MSGSNQVNQAGTYGVIGQASSTNIPGGREFAVSWIDSSNDLWLFGGYGYDSVDILGDALLLIALSFQLFIYYC